MIRHDDGAGSRSVGAVLVGGRSRRFGAPKAFASLCGRTLLDRVVSAHRSALETVVIVGGSVDEFGFFGVPVLEDRLPVSGPLAGLHAALVWAGDVGADGVCLTGCDTPLLESGLLRTLLEHREQNDAVLPMVGWPARYQPLFGWYSTRLGPALADFLSREQPKVTRFVETIERVKLLRPEELKLTRPPEAVFLNINTPADLNAAAMYLQEYPDEG